MSSEGSCGLFAFDWGTVSLVLFFKKITNTVEGHRNESATILDLALTSSRFDAGLLRNIFTEQYHVLIMLARGRAQLWCVLVCHPHLTIIICCKAVLGTGMPVGTKNKFCHYRASLVLSASAIVFLSLLVCLWGSITIPLLLLQIIRIRNCDNSCSVCVGKHVTASRCCRHCARLGDGRSTVGSGARRGTKSWRIDEDTVVGAPSKFLRANTGVHIPTRKRNLEEPAGGMAVETAQRRELDCSRGRHGRCVGAG